MKISLRFAWCRLTLLALLTGLGTGQAALAQLSDIPAAPPPPLSAENQARVALNRDNYRFALAGYESAPTGPCYILSVEPLTRNKFLYRGRIWVDAVDFAVVRIESTPAQNPSFWTKETRIEQVYAEVGEFWLPLSNRSNSLIRLGGHAYFTIDYQNYQITAAAPLGTRNVAGRQ